MVSQMLLLGALKKAGNIMSTGGKFRQAKMLYGPLKTNPYGKEKKEVG